MRCSRLAISYTRVMIATVRRASGAPESPYRAVGPSYSCPLLGRLAVDKRYRGQGLGERLLLDALYWSWRLFSEIASVAVVVDAEDDHARAFYLCYEFLPFPEQEQRLFLPMSTVERLFKA